MSDTVINVNGFSKRYRIGLKEMKADTFAGQLANLAKAPIKNFRQLARMTRFGKEDESVFWALKDVNFSVKQGEVLGIIGANGAGKSTLLKILSRITEPTEGEAIIKGRVASLLEVGTGFHSELTGRENIFMNGTILGMTKKEIDRKLDEIIDFSGIEKFVDTPVKFYSSGMKVRLGFSVAANLESEILIIDEVLAVGDAEFQKKCLGKMGDLSRGAGRTVIFVSHNMHAVSNLCSRGLVIDNGKVVKEGNISECVRHYFISLKDKSILNTGKGNRLNRTNGDALFEEIRLLNNNNENWEFGYDEPIALYLRVAVQARIDNLLFYVALKQPYTGDIITNYKTVISDHALDKGDGISFSLTIPPKALRPGNFALYFAIGNKEAKTFYDVVDENVNMPYLKINPVNLDVHDNSGYVSLPFKVELGK